MCECPQYFPAFHWQNQQQLISYLGCIDTIIIPINAVTGGNVVTPSILNTPKTTQVTG